MRRHPDSHADGGTLVAVLIVVFVTAALVGVTIRFSSQNNRLAARQREVMSSVAAADGALEYAYAVWKDTIRKGGMRAPTTTQLNADQRIKDLQLADNSAKSPAQELSSSHNAFSNFTLASTDPWGTVAPDPSIATSYSVAVDGYPGWKGNAYFYKAMVKAKGPKTPGMSSAPAATISRYFSLTNVPLFQAAIFYMDNLEIHPGALMSIRGLVHTNANLYAAGYAKLQFLGNVSYVGSFNESAPGIGDWTGAGTGETPTITPYWRDDKQSSTSTEKAKQLSPVERIEPFGKKPA
jgi:Tfp pilus assembly protein PilE